MMQCHRGPTLRHSGCLQLRSRAMASSTTFRRQPPRVACEFGTGRSAWPLQQRFSDVRHRVEQVFHNAGDAIKGSPPARALESAYRPVQQAVAHQWDRFAYAYADFTSEETKRKWKWSRQMEKEAKFWRSTTTFLAVLLATMLWEALTPVSVLWGFAAPVFMSWVCYDRPIMNPIIVGLLLLLPYKFVPGAAIRLI